MRIVVCIKHIGDISGVQDDGVPEPRFVPGMPSPLDLNAVEEALQLRSTVDGEVIALTVGPPAADGSLRKALMMGVDRAVRLWDAGLDNADAFGIALVLARTAQKIGFDLLLCGARSGGTGSEVVGAMLAEHLGLPLIARAIGLRFSHETGRIIAEKKLERGWRETYAVPLPAVLAIDRGVAPRYLGPRWVHRLLKGRVEVLTPANAGLELPLPAPRIKALALTAPKPRTKIGVKVSGLSLKEKLMVMRGQTGHSQRGVVADERPEDAAKKIKEHLERWLE